MPMTGARPTFETEPCTRCMGGGWYSYCELWGKTCFKCGVTPHAQGIGRQLTRRGAAAYEYYVSLLPTRAAADLKPGDVLWDVMGYRKLPVISAPVPTTSAVIRGGERITAGYIDIQCRGVCLCLVQEATIYRIVPSAAARAECLAKALEYQATLTKAGKPQKRQRATAAA